MSADAAGPFYLIRSVPLPYTVKGYTNTKSIKCGLIQSTKKITTITRRLFLSLHEVTNLSRQHASLFLENKMDWFVPNVVHSPTTREHQSLYEI